MFEWVSNVFGGSHDAPAAAPAAAPVAAREEHSSTNTSSTSSSTSPSTDSHPTSDGEKKPKAVDQKEMDKAANNIFKKMDGWWVSGSDKSGILDTLRGKSPEEVAAIKHSYAEHFPGHDMDKDLGKNLSGKDLQEAKASMSGDTVGAAVAAIKNAETGTWLGNVDSDRVNTVLGSISDPKQREEVRKQVSGELKGLQSGNDSKLTQALLEGDTATASAVKIDTAQHSWSSVLSQGVNKVGFGGLLGKDFGTDKDAINSAIEACKTPEERKKLQAQYKAQTGTDLNKDLDAHLDGANRDVATKLMDGDAAAANAARMKAATEHWFTDKDAIYKAMEGKPDAERKTMMADYQKMYGQSADKMMDENLSGLDREKAKELEDKGKLTDAFALKYAQEGSFWSTDKTLIKDTLAGKTKEQIAALSGEYKTKYGIDLQKELGETTSGRDGFEIKELLKGEPQTIDDKMARARERYDFERGSGSNVLSKGIVDTFSDKGAMLDQQQARMEELYKKIQSGGGTSEEKALLDRVTGYQNLDTKNYQETKDSVTNGAVAVAAVTAGAIATVATGGAAAPAEAAIIAALAAGGATIATKAIIQDSGYSNEELRNDIIMTGVNVATAGTMGALGSEGGALFNLAGKVSDNPMVQQAIIQGATGAVSTGVGNATQATISGKSMPEILKAGGMGVITGGAGAATTGALGAGLKGSDAFKGMDPIQAAVLRNAIAGGTGGAVSTALDPAAYQGDSAALLMKWGTAVGGGALTGAAGGYNEGKIEVETAAKLQQAEADQQKTKAPPPTADEQNVIAKAKEFAENPAEVKQLDSIQKQLEHGELPKLPVEADPMKGTSVGGDPVTTAAPAKAEEIPAPTKTDHPPTKLEDVVAKAATGSSEIETTKAGAKSAATPPEAVTETPKYNAEQKAVMELAAGAKTKADWEAIRQMQKEVGLPVAPADAADRQALVELSRSAKAEDVDTIKAWARELDTKNPNAPHDAMSQLIEESKLPSGKIDPKKQDGLIDLMGGLHEDARATDLNAGSGKGAGKGVIDNVEEAGLSKLRGQLGTDKLDFSDSMRAHGIDPKEATALMEKLRGVDSGENAPLAHKVSGIDHTGGELAAPSTLTAAEKKLWVEMMAARFGDMQVGKTEMSKILIEKDAKAYADGSRDQVGGFVSMQAHSEGLKPGEALQMAGLDSDWHHDVAKVFDKNTNTWTDSAAKDRGLDVLNFPLSQQVHDQLQVPLGTDAKAIMQGEAARLQTAQTTPSALGRTEAVPELLQPKVDASGKVAVDSTGKPELPHVTEMNREHTPIVDASGNPVGDSNPFTGWGFSATRRATDGVGGPELPVIPNQELKMANRVQIPEGSELGVLNPTAEVESHYSLGGGKPVKKIEDIDMPKAPDVDPSPNSTTE